LKKITFLEAMGHTAPQPMALICAPRPDGSTNLATVAWWTYLDTEPDMIGFAMGKGSYTCQLVSETGKAVICLPGVDIADEVLKCGFVSGREVDKAKEYNIALTGDEQKYPVKSKVAFLCDVDREVIVGGCVFFICKVNEIHFDETQRHVYNIEGYHKLGAL